MVQISLDKASVEFGLFSGRDQSFRRTLVQAATGGKLLKNDRGRVAVQALEDIDLLVEPGERIGLIGHNGSGKSTLLRVVSRVYTPTSGRAVMTGSIGTLIDISLGMNPEATGRKNIYLRGAMLGLTKKTVDQSFEEIVEFSGLGDFIEMPLRTYSTGMQLRLSFAVSTIVIPDILVMDEWLSVGDDSFRAQAEARLKDLVAGSKILVIASHSKELLERTCTRGIVLEHGRIVQDAPIHEVTESYFGPKD